jgi:peptide deformylase
VVARGWDMHGEPVTVEGSELLARCIQHETDHLDGVLFVDRLDAETRKQAMAEIRAAEWFGATDLSSPGDPRTTSPIVKVSPHPLFGKTR